MSAEHRPSIFIGSSVEGLDVAYAMQECLEYDAEPTVWTQGIFSPTASTLNDLLRVARTTDFAAFVFTPDDLRVMRDEKSKTPRDNVIFELGLLIGARGSERCFFLTPGDERLHLPTDLLGLMPLTYMSKRRDGNLVAALGPSANKIRRILNQMGPSRVQGEVTMVGPPPDPSSEAAEFVHRWNSVDLLAARALLRRTTPLHMTEDETGEPTAAMRRAFSFFESMADGVLAGRVDEDAARAEFAAPMHAIWQRAYTYLAPLNLAAEWWDPPPKIQELDRRWQVPDR